MGWLDRWRTPVSDVVKSDFEGSKLSEFGEPLMLVADGYVEQSDYESYLIEIIIDWMAEAFSRAEIQVQDENGTRVIDHPVERAYRDPKNGTGQFWRGTMADWFTRGMWVHGFDKTPGRRIYKVFRIPRGQLQVPRDDVKRPVWLWTRRGRIRRLSHSDFVWGIWTPDDSNEYNGIAPVSSKGMKNILRLGREALKYEFDGFARSGGRGLLVADPALANLARFKTKEEREEYRQAAQESWENVTTGKNRGAPIVTDGIETKITEYGVDLAALNMREVHSFVAEALLARFQLPPSSAGIRIGRDPTYANSRTWETVAYERGVKPRQDEIAERLSDMLLTERERSIRGLKVVFQTDDAVRAKLEDRQILERLHLDRLNKGAAAVWEVRPHLEGLDPDPGLELQLQGAHMLRLSGASPQLSLDDPRLAEVVGDAIELEGVAPPSAWIDQGRNPERESRDDEEERRNG